MAARNQMLGMAAQDPRLIRVRPNGLEDVPQYRIDVDWEKAGALGVPINAIHNTIAAAFGSAYVNDFIQGGRVKRVFVQADAAHRMLPSDLERLYVRNQAGTMTPFTSFASGHWSYGSPRLERFNAFPSMNILGEPPPGKSSGEAMQAMEEIVAKLPKGIGYDWTGLSYQERHGNVPGPAAVRVFDDRDFPVPGGPIRELDGAHFDHAGAAAGGHRRSTGLVAIAGCPTTCIFRSGCSPFWG